MKQETGAEGGGLYPLVDYPDPRGPRDDGMERDPIQVQRNWSIDEIHEVVKDLPDPKDSAVRWCAAITELVSMYQPSAAELEVVFRKFFKLRWGTLKEGWNASVTRRDPAFGEQLTTVMDRVCTMYPSRTDWLQIHATRQETDEKCDDYRSRMEENFQKFSGLALDNPAHGDLLKTSLVNGLLPHIKEKSLVQQRIDKEGRAVGLEQTEEEAEEEVAVGAINNKRTDGGVILVRGMAIFLESAQTDQKEVTGH
ncbi:hypothetical protein AAFF_G00412470 [Aldrovandia affinis]|uniref:Uncharacterized protein n=1 Tax=Aldrovandia affinis TaxID=143900 RepID=A0AAD7R3P6_9TELE|nr:hypothetical protein AAFF_G00412470 [Aldrovandia affinis]